jgi:hypothetical protein
VDLGPQGAWLKDLGWGWGLTLLAAIVLPWAMMITVATDGAFWSTAVAGDLAPKLAGGQESHGAPFGSYALAAFLLVFPATLLLPAGLVQGWTGRKEPGVRFALCWLIPTWLVFEILPTKLVHYTLPAVPALAMLMAAALRAPLGSDLAAIGAILSALAGLLLAGLAIYLCRSSTATRSDIPWTAVTALLFLAAGVVGAVLLMRKTAATALVAAGVIGIAAHAALVGLLVPAAGAAAAVAAPGEGPGTGRPGAPGRRARAGGRHRLRRAQHGLPAGHHHRADRPGRRGQGRRPGPSRRGRGPPGEGLPGRPRRPGPDRPPGRRGRGLRLFRRRQGAPDALSRRADPPDDEPPARDRRNAESQEARP